MKNQVTSNSHHTRHRSDNQKLWLGLGMGALFTLLFMLTYEGYLPVTTSFLMGALFTVVCIVLVIILGMYIFRDRLIRRWLGKDVDIDHFASDIKWGIESVSSHFIESTFVNVDARKKEEIKWLFPRFIRYVLFANLRNWGMRLAITVLAAIGSLLGTILLFHQNQLLQKQNEKIDHQILLEEASRRSSLNFLLAHVLDIMDEELKEADRLGRPRRLSPQVIGRFASLSQSYQPYRFMDGDTMITLPLSPERGNLLLAIANSHLDTITLDQIFEKTIFSSANLQGAILDSIYLRKAGFYQVNLRDANLSGADLRKVDLVRADLKSANLKGADLSFGSLVSVQLNESTLAAARMTGANLMQSTIRNADLSSANLSRASLVGADLSFSRLTGADLSGAYLTGAALIGAELTGADLRGALMNETDLNGTTLTGTNLNGVNLSGARNLSSGQLQESKSLYNAQGIPDSISTFLRKAKPHLFEVPR